MSAETMEWLNTNTLIGYSGTRGKAWHYDESLQGVESNHYDGPVPAADVARRLFNWEVKLAHVVNADTMDVADGYRIAYRSDTGQPFGVFSDSYKVHPYEEWLIDNVSSILDVAKGEL